MIWTSEPILQLVAIVCSFCMSMVLYRIPQCNTYPTAERHLVQTCSVYMLFGSDWDLFLLPTNCSGVCLELEGDPVVQLVWAWLFWSLIKCDYSVHISTKESPQGGKWGVVQLKQIKWQRWKNILKHWEVNTILETDDSVSVTLIYHKT